VRHPLTANSSSEAKEKYEPGRGEWQGWGGETREEWSKKNRLSLSLDKTLATIQNREKCAKKYPTSRSFSQKKKKAGGGGTTDGRRVLEENGSPTILGGRANMTKAEVE